MKSDAASVSVLNAFPEKHFSPRVDQSMFENSIAQQQSRQPPARRSAASINSGLGSGCVDSPSSGGQQRLKNAINLGKAVGAKVNDLLRRKESSHFGDIGVTEVNKNVGAVWSCMDQLNPSNTHSHISSFDSFPRLDPPPPSGKKRLPRALKTTQDMMISSDPVVSSPDPADASSFLPSPDKAPLIIKEEQQQGEKEEEEVKGGEEEERATDVTLSDESKADPETNGTNGKVGRGAEEEEVEGGGVEERQHQLQLSVPDLINKDLPVESRAKPYDVWQKAPGPDSRLASTPRSGKTQCRISLGEAEEDEEEEVEEMVLLGNGAPCSKGSVVSADDAEPHPDLLSFE